MVLDVITCLLGLALAYVTLRDVFDTVVVPGGSRAALRVARHVIALSLPIWKWARRSGRGVSVTFAPFVLTASFITWMLLLMLAFGLMAYGFRTYYTPILTSFPEALYIAGSGLATLGLSEIGARGPARWITVGSGFCGLAVVTMAVTYLLEVQNSIALRDAGILKLGTAAGRPPAAVGLLERYAALGCQDELPRLLRDGRDWCAAVLQSHAAHPSLIYFRTIGTGAGWPAALGTFMDLAVLMEIVVDYPAARGAAVLLREEGHRMARDLADLAGLAARPVRTSHADVEQIYARLAAAGYALQPVKKLDRLMALRDSYAGCIAALADHLGTAEAPLLPA